MTATSARGGTESSPLSVEIDRAAAVELLLRMLAIPGKSCQEAAVMAGIRLELLQAGLPESVLVQDDVPRLSPAGGEIGNLIVKLPGTRRGPRRLLMAHVDTVPLCVGAEPQLDQGWIRSANPATALGGDDRAGASAILMALVTILRKRLPHPPVTFFWPVQEEIGLYGARFVKLSQLGNPKLGFNWDGSAPHLACIGATGDYNFDVEIDGIASHAGVAPEQGVSAIAVAALAIADLQNHGWHGLVKKGRSTGTSNIGVIQAGEATNVVTPNLKLRGEVRSHDPRFRTRLLNEFRKAFERAARQVQATDGRRAQVRFESELKYESFRLSPDEPCVQAALQAIRAVGLPAETRISNGGLDANWLTSRGLPTVTLGCGQADVHTVREALDVEAYLHACRIALRLATGTEGA